MANLQESYEWPNGIHEIAEDEPVTGGPDGPDNVPPRQLAGRTQFLAADDLVIADVAAMGLKEATKTITQRLQEGFCTIYNRGVISGCSGSKAASGRKVILSAGGIFALGKEISCAGDQSGVAVPNGGAAASIYYGYLSVAANGALSFRITEAGAAVPPDGISVCRITVPADNTASDLSGVTVADTRKVESSYPTVLNSLPYASVALAFNTIDTNYAVFLDVLSFSGWQQDAVYAADKATNGFKIFIGGAVDAVNVRWLAAKLSL